MKHLPALTGGPIRRHRAFAGRLAAAALLCLCAGAGAADLQVSPISLEFAPREQAQGIWLSNTGTTPLRAQVRVQQWSQADGTDQLTATRELTANPPAVDIPPGEKQLVRIIRQASMAASQLPAREQTYRLIIDELPAAAPAAAVETAPRPGLKFLLRYSVPVFVTTEEPQLATGKPSDLSALSATLQTTTQPPVLTIRNGGNKRYKISQFTYVDATGQRKPLVPGLVGYVLAGQQMQWPINPSALPGAPLNGTFKAKFNADLEEQTLPLVVDRP